MTPLAPSAVLPAWLEQLLRDHGRSHGLYYNGFLADHLPMASLALHELGAPAATVRAYAERYCERLVPAEPHSAEAASGFEPHLGDREAFPALLAFFDREVEREGPEAVVRATLPWVLSGWVADAYHAIIRLGYGLRFGCSAEVAAGLAYMVACGPDPRLAEQAGKIREGSRLPEPERMEGVVFLQWYEGAIRAGRVPETAGALPADPKAIAEFALAGFNATQDFFALHVVTGTHAYLTCAPYLADDPLPLLRAGVAAGFLSIGAPSFEPDTPPRPAKIDDEHDTKIAFTCADLARHLESPPFQEAARTYHPAEVVGGGG